jgi:hypothetical protein
LLAETRGSTPKRVVKKRQRELASGEKKDKAADEGEDEDAHSEEDKDEGSEDGSAGRVRADNEPRFRPFKCQVVGCEWSFETAQRLKMHGRVHQCTFRVCSSLFGHVKARETEPARTDDQPLITVLAKRYTCSHRDHTDSLPSFSRWSDLQAHIKTEHPPVCPYEACHVSSAHSA